MTLKRPQLRTLSLLDPDVVRVRRAQLDMIRHAWGEMHQPYIAAKNADNFPRMLIKGGGNIEKIGRFSIDRAFALRYGDRVQATQCWVAATEPYYRTIFHRYLKQFQGFPLDARLPSILAVDHVLNREFAVTVADQKFILLTMVDSVINSAFGAVFEVNAASNAMMDPPEADFGGEYIPRQRGGPRFGGEAYPINWPIMGKIFAETAPQPKVDERYVLGVIVRLCRERMLRFELEDPYWPMSVVFRRGERGVPHFDAQGRMPATTVIAGRALNGEMPLRVWLDAYLAELGEDDAGDLHVRNQVLQ